MQSAKLGCRITRFGEVASFQGQRTTQLGDKLVIYRQGGIQKEDFAHRFEHAASCLCRLTVPEGSPTPCAWCEGETGIKTKGSHGICDRHSKEVLGRYLLSKGRTGEIKTETCAYCANGEHEMDILEEVCHCPCHGVRT